MSNSNVIWTLAFTVLSGGRYFGVRANCKKLLFLVIAKVFPSSAIQGREGKEETKEAVVIPAKN